jgi:hypothetical protein
MDVTIIALGLSGGQCRRSALGHIPSFIHNAYRGTGFVLNSIIIRVSK